MSNLWLKIRIWTKTIVVFLVLIYALMFILKNQEPAKVWLFFGTEATMPASMLIVTVFFIGVVSFVLLRAAFGTIRQIKEYRAKAEAEKMARDVADMKTKAAMLKTKPEVDAKT